MIHIAPSILNADFARLGEQVLQVQEAGAHRLHLDVMDGHFVPNLSMGPAVAASLRPCTWLPLEVHLMVTAPAKFAEPFIKAGADRLIVHHEVLPDPRPLLQRVRDLGASVGLAINPDTPVEVLTPYLPLLDLALCMTVFPGFGGQKFIPASVDRIRRLRDLIEQHNPNCELEVDGGIDHATALTAVAAGAKVLVVGTALFRHAQGPAAALTALTASFQNIA